MALENFKFYKIRLDRADMTIAAPLTAKEGAVNGNGIELQIINGSIIDDMTNIAVYLNWKHLTSGQQGSEPFVLYDLAKGIYRLHYPTEMLSLGTIRADIKVVDAQSVTVSTSEVLIKVAEAATDSTTQSENAWNDIQTILVSQQVISERLTELENGGIVGPPGADGNDGKSAYEIAVQNGFIGTEVEWLASLKGADGSDGADGQNGTDGSQGIPGTNGTDGKSAYQIALDNGFVGTETQWLASLKGADGTDGIDGTNGTNGTNGTDGADGKSAYQSALDGGFVGTELQFNEALAEVNNKQEALVSGTNIKTINGNPILGSGDLIIATSSDWNTIGATLAYASADSPTFVANTSVDLTSVISVGMKIKLTQTTVKYFIVTAITSTTITLYGGTDYTLSNATITLPYFSSMKAPYGFPLNPDKWTITLTSTTSDAAQLSPTVDVWYNLGGLSISIPIGVWNCSWKVALQVNSGTSTGGRILGTVSTTNNSETISDFTIMFNVTLYQLNIIGVTIANKTLSLTSKTTHYFLGLAKFNSQLIKFDNNESTMVFKAVCAYL